MLVDFPRGLGLAFRCFHEGFWNSLQCLTVFSEDSFDLLSDACWFPRGLRLPLNACLVFPELWSSPQCLFGIPWAVVFPSMLVWYSLSCGLPLDACLVFHELWSSLRCLLAVPEYTGFLVDACWFSFSIPALSRMFVGFLPRTPDFSPELGLSVVVILSDNIISMIKVGLLMSTFRRTLPPLSSHLVSLCLSII